MKTKKRGIRKSTSGGHRKPRRQASKSDDVALKFQEVFTSDEVRVSLTTPEPNGDHFILIECRVRRGWFPVGVLRGRDVVPTLRLLTKAYDRVSPGELSWMTVE